MISRYSELFKPLCECPLQGYLGRGVHTLGLLRWILEQTGKADVYVSTFSTSDDFLSGFLRLKKDGLVAESYLLADLKASKKTLQLSQLMQNCFTEVCLAANHSKIVLVRNDTYCVCCVTSQNQTYGDRNESTIISTDKVLYQTFYNSFQFIIDCKSVKINGIIKRHTSGQG